MTEVFHESTEWFMDLGTCDRCKQPITGSHYHCGGCDSTDQTSSYGHHSKFCKVATKKNNKLTYVDEFHHCGPDGDCELNK